MNPTVDALKAPSLHARLSTSSSIAVNQEDCVSVAFQNQAKAVPPPLVKALPYLKTTTLLKTSDLEVI